MAALDVSERGPLSFCQELLLLRALRDPGFRPVIADVVALDGDIDPDQVAVGLAAMQAGHDALRTAFLWEAGTCVAEVRRTPAPLAHRIVNGEGLAPAALVQLIGASLAGIDPALGQTLASVIIRRGPQRCLWMLGFHHLVSDGWSQHLYGATFSQAVGARSHATPARSALEYASRQRAWLRSTEAQAQLDWWLRRMDELTGERSLPVRRAARTAASGWRAEVRLGPAAHGAVHAAARMHRAPFLALAFAVFARTMTGRGGGDTAMALSMVGGRNLPGGYAAGGAFYNSVPLSVASFQSSSAADLLQRVRRELFEVLKRQELPAALLSRALVARGRMGLAEFAPVTFNLIHHGLSEFKLVSGEMREVDLTTLEPIEVEAEVIRVRSIAATGANGPLTLAVSDLEAELRIFVDGSPELDSEDGQAFLSAYVDELKRFCAELGQAPEAERAVSRGRLWARPSA